MKTVFNENDRNALIGRIQMLHAQSTAQWGKMNVQQMIQHCINADDMILQNKKFKLSFIGRLIGPRMLRNELKDDRPLPKNTPTIDSLKSDVVDEPLEQLKNTWISRLNNYAHYDQPDYSFLHPFFGKMTKKQIGQHMYKHADHHLRQFGG